MSSLLAYSQFINFFKLFLPHLGYKEKAEEQKIQVLFPTAWKRLKDLRQNEWQSTSILLKSLIIFFGSNCWEMLWGSSWLEMCFQSSLLSAKDSQLGSLLTMPFPGSNISMSTGSARRKCFMTTGGSEGEDSPAVDLNEDCSSKTSPESMPP